MHLLNLHCLPPVTELLMSPVGEVQKLQELEAQAPVPIMSENQNPDGKSLIHLLAMDLNPFTAPNSSRHSRMFGYYIGLVVLLPRLAYLCKWQPSPLPRILPSIPLVTYQLQVGGRLQVIIELLSQGGQVSTAYDRIENPGHIPDD